MSRSRSIAGWLAVAVCPLAVALAQDYPSKPIRIITGGAGGGNDFTARQLAQGASGALGQSIIVDNRTGFLAADTVSKAPPDGYTLTLNGASLWVSALLQKMPYDAIRDFSPVTLTEKTTNIVAVHPSMPVKSVKELIALATARPGQLNYGRSVTGSSNHLAGELFRGMAGINIVNVPYKASAPVITALMGGEVQLTIIDVGLVLPHMASAKLRGLAVTSLDPSALAPGLPTVAASGVPGYEAVTITGILAPAKTAPAIINRLNHEFVRVLLMPDVKERFLNAGIEITTSTPEQFSAAMRSDIAKWEKVIKQVGIKVE